MASPSQPPSGSSTSRILFASDFAQSTYTLIDIPKGLEKYIDDHDTNLTLHSDDEETLIEHRPWLDDGKETAAGTRTKKTTKVAVDILESILELVPVAPRLDRLAELLGQSLYEGRAQDRKLNAEKPKYTTEQLQSVVQASDVEIDTWLKEHHACQIDGYWRLLDPRYLFDVIQEILLTMKVLDMPPEAVDSTRLMSTIMEGETDMEDWLVQHALQTFSQDHENKDQNSTLIALSADKVCGFLGTHLLATRERGSRWPVQEFLSTWRKLVHDHFQIADLTSLAGHVIEERVGGQLYIRYFSRADLSSDPIIRFKALFEVKSQWESQEIRPFLRDLVVDEKKLDLMLMKHARGVKQSDGRAVYHSRIK
ncbi:hypothetical protein BGZ73_005859 [Actinomortierella ambigua]|nr:hypothetical protein BGZ73_005859 [Actinomortierella ambigua]